MIGIAIRSTQDEERYQLDINQTDGSIGFQVLKNNDRKFQLDFIIEPEEWKQIKTFIDQSLTAEKALAKKDAEPVQTFVKLPIK